MFKIVESVITFYLKKNFNSAILNRWEFFSGIIDYVTCLPWGPYNFFYTSHIIYKSFTVIISCFSQVSVLELIHSIFIGSVKMYIKIRISNPNLLEGDMQLVSSTIIYVFWKQKCFITCCKLIYSMCTTVLLKAILKPKVWALHWHSPKKSSFNKGKIIRYSRSTINAYSLLSHE